MNRPALLAWVAALGQHVSGWTLLALGVGLVLGLRWAGVVLIAWGLVNLFLRPRSPRGAP